MIKYSQLPGVKSFKTMREMFNHISEELTKFHTKTQAVRKTPAFKHIGAKDVRNRK